MTIDFDKITASIGEMRTDLSMEQINSEFEKYDVNKDGKIDRVEARDFIFSVFKFDGISN